MDIAFCNKNMVSIMNRYYFHNQKNEIYFYKLLFPSILLEHEFFICTFNSKNKNDQQSTNALLPYSMLEIKNHSIISSLK